MRIITLVMLVLAAVAASLSAAMAPLPPDASVARGRGRLAVGAPPSAVAAPAVASMRVRLALPSVCTIIVGPVAPPLVNCTGGSPSRAVVGASGDGHGAPEVRQY